MKICVRFWLKDSYSYSNNYHQIVRFIFVPFLEHCNYSSKQFSFRIPLLSCSWKSFIKIESQFQESSRTETLVILHETAYWLVQCGSAVVEYFQLFVYANINHRFITCWDNLPPHHHHHQLLTLTYNTILSVTE